VTPVWAERLPTTIYTTADGLANDTVYRILADSRGFIWFATREGLSRFDGYTFTNYGVDDGLPSGVVNDLLETRDGVYLFATSGGLARLESNRRRPAGAGAAEPLFSVHAIAGEPSTESVTALYEDSRGQVWVGTRTGLLRLENPSGNMRFHAVALGPPSIGEAHYVSCIREDRFGTIWVATGLGLRRLWPGGRLDLHFPDSGFHSVLPDRAGYVWAGTRSDGLFELTFDDSGRLAEARRWDTSNGLPSLWINQLFEDADGGLYAASTGGLVQLVRQPSGRPHIRVFADAQGLGRGEVQSLTRDRHGNLWAATQRGAVRIARSGFSTFGPADGIAWGASLMQTRAGDVCFLGPGPGAWGLRCFNGVSFDVIRPRSPDGLSWGWNQMALEDRTGAWWLATREGVARFASVARPHQLHGRSPARWYGMADGLVAPVILRLFEDSRGDVWIAPVGEGGRSGLSRWERATDRLHHYSAEPNLPNLDTHYVTAFGEDRSSNVWIGFNRAGGIVRYRNGAFDRPDTRGFFRAMVRNIFCDSAGRVWFATFHGLVRADDPGGQSPAFTAYTTRDGLSSNEISAVAEDLQGRLYVNTGRGVDRLEPTSGRVKRFTARDGYIAGETLAALLDRRTGHIWFAQRVGVSRLIPTPDGPPLPPPILITGLEVAGQPEPLNPLGHVSLPEIRIEPGRNHVRIEYVALGFGPGEDLRYQYRLEGAQEDWSAPSAQRSVNFESLAPGSYRFVVRALSADGVASSEPASVAVTILPPIWQRWWFLALAATTVASLLYAAYRYRLARALEIAHVRTRIATDLHDDIGANLTKIAILSEVARQQVRGAGEVGERLSTIARISRESVASMSDVVWAINPQRDSLRDTIRRMRQHAEELLAGRGVMLAFHASDTDQQVRMPIDVRREAFLIFKEALNNAVRHSRCRTVTIDIHPDGPALRLRIVDDGVGFKTDADPAGNGLASMRLRAGKIQAVFEVVSVPGHGTTVLLSVPGTFGGRVRRPA
jgi:signal transduction histidine kinase/ligand-binding sensor domain-containing protein